MRILLIDAYESHRKVMIDFFYTHRPDIKVDVYDPVIVGKPAANFDWQQYQLVIMDTQLGDDDGLAWFRELREIKDFPSLVFLSLHNKVDIAVEAMKLGARDFILKKGIRSQRLKQMMAENLPERTTTDFVPQVKPVPEEKPKQAVRSVASEPDTVKVEKPAPAAPLPEDDEYWDQQTQILYNPPKPAAS